MLFTFVDADFAHNPTIRKLVSGILHQFGGASIHWSSKVQNTVALSTIKA
jgi:hypothetical protein